MARSRVGRGQRACTLLKARHAVVDVPRVRVHGREADRGEVMGEVVAVLVPHVTVIRRH